MHTDLLSHVATLMELKGESAWRRPSCSFTSCSKTSGSVCGRVIDEFISIRIQAYYSAVLLLKRRSSSTLKVELHKHPELEPTVLLYLPHSGGFSCSAVSPLRVGSLCVDQTAEQTRK